MFTFRYIPILRPFLFLPFLFLWSGAVHAGTLPKVRVYYEKDGRVLITSFVAEACIHGETDTACMDRITIQNSMGNMEYEDMFPQDLPQDRTFRDKWRGAKGRGIHIDQSIITQQDKIKEYRTQLEEELDKESPNPSRVLKMQRMIEKFQDIGKSVLTQDDIVSIEGLKKRGFFATAINAVGDAISSVFNGVKQGFLALASLVTDKLQVGTADAPSGITIYDVKTKKPYCMVMSNGKMESIPGECGALEKDDSIPETATEPPLPQPQTQTEPTISPETFPVDAPAQPTLESPTETPSETIPKNEEIPAIEPSPIDTQASTSAPALSSQKSHTL